MSVSNSSWVNISSTGFAITASIMAAATLALAMHIVDKKLKQKSLNEIIDNDVLKSAGNIDLKSFISKDFAALHLAKLNLVDQDIQLSLSLKAKLLLVDLSHNALQSFPSYLLNSRLLVELNLSFNKIKELPECLESLRNLKKLNLMHNLLDGELNDSIGHLTNLEVLGLKGNRITLLPESIANCVNLVELYLTDNKLTTLPAGISKCSKLRKLQASFNEFAYLPEDLSGLISLELFRMAGNPSLASIPVSLLKLPRITWLSLAGSLWSPGLGVYHEGSHASIRVDQITLGKKLGQGASGSVYAAKFNEENVAVKIFNGEVSPDGRAVDELDVSCSLHHENLTEVLGVIPGAQPWAIMKLVPHEYQPLADRPNASSILRSRWDASRNFSTEAVLRIGVCIARAMQYLHSKNIAHGDLYAHNILADSNGHAILCDFGSSFYYPMGDDELNFEAVEVRAFGLFMGELSLSNDSWETSWIPQDLTGQCLKENASDRPTFLELGNQLEAELMQVYRSVPLH